VSNEVVFSSDKEAGTQNVYRLNPANNRVTKLTNYTDGDVSTL
jgi:Tol biopolymer transport system component